MNSTKRLTNIISVTLGFRLFSMSTIIPFLSVYALHLKGGAPWLTGYALGIFGLTQAILQIPFGALSDKIGYKKMMIAGLFMLIAGLFTAAYAKSIYWLIFARALQGSGAIVTVGYSWISSVSSNENRDKNLTKLGAILGTFNMLSYTLGPLIHIFLSVSEMFVFSAILIIGCLIWVLCCTKQVNPTIRKSRSIENKKGKTVFTKKNLLMGFMLTVNNLIMMAFFFMLPILLNGILDTNKMWIILTPAILIAIGMLKFSAKMATHGNAKNLIYILFILQGIGFIFIYFRTLAGIMIGTILLMTGVFSLSTIVPMLLNKDIDNKQRGKGNGIIVSLQYFGSFLGAALTGTFWSISPNFAFGFIGLMTITGLLLVRIFPYKK